MFLGTRQKHHFPRLSNGWLPLFETCYENYQRSVYKTYGDRRPGSLKCTSYLVVTGLYGSVQVQFRFCQFSEMQLKSVIGSGGSENEEITIDLSNLLISSYFALSSFIIQYHLLKTVHIYSSTRISGPVGPLILGGCYRRMEDGHTALYIYRLQNKIKTKIFYSKPYCCQYYLILLN